MRNILINIATEPKAQVAGKEYQGRRFELLQEGVVIKETPVILEDTVQFVEVPEGLYVARVSDIGADGTVLGVAEVVVNVVPGGAGPSTYPAVVGVSYTLE